MSTSFTEYFIKEIGSLNVTISQLEARLEKGRLLHEREKDATKRNQIEIQWARLLAVYNRACAVVQILSGQRTPAKEGVGFCVECLGFLHKQEIEDFFKDYEDSMGNKGVPK